MPDVEYEFGGPLGASAIVAGLPVLLYFFAFACNDVSGCPVPSLLDPRSFSWDRFQAETAWPGLRKFFSWDVTAVVLAYYLVSLILWRVLPAQETYGTKLVHHGKPLKYRFNSFSSTLLQLAVCAGGTYLQGADFVVWTYITDHYVQIFTANVVLAYLLSVLVYWGSFSVDTRYPNPDMRELARGGHTGSMVYDFYIGRELNPRVTLPWFGEIDLKTWLEFRPGLTGWLLLDLAFIAKQYRTYGFVADSILVTTAMQAFYVLDGQYMEAGILTMMDTTTDGLGFMLVFGDIAWVPFLYSTQCRYLSVYPLQLGWTRIAAMVGVGVLGLYIFRAANSQKHVFRTRPDDPRVRRMSYLQTRRGTRLLTSGWWGVSRHINYLGDWMQAAPFSLPTGFAGYVISPAGLRAGATAAAAAAGSFQMHDGREVVPGRAWGWGVFFTYFYVVYFAVLLIHRERRDDAMCARKYGDDWGKYKKAVPWRIVPWVY